MSFSAFLHGEVAQELEQELVDELRKLAGSLLGVASAEFQGEHTGAVNLLNPAPAEDSAEDQAPADPPVA